ncbi:RICIN domain-containing protein [Lentzea sp. NPDC004782]
MTTSGMSRRGFRLSQRALNVPDASTADGTVLDQWDYQNAPQEQWQLIPS